MITDASGALSDEIRLQDRASKGRSGGVVFMSKRLRTALLAYGQGQALKRQSVVNLLWSHYRKCDIAGASSHSGRRTFITNAARKISLVGGSVRDIQALARHKNLQTTQRYVEQNTEAQRLVVNLL